MKKFVGMFLVIFLIMSFCSVLAHAITTEYKNEEHEQYLWNELSKYSPSDEITAGIMGYFMRESQLKSDAVHRWTYWNQSKEIHDICNDFTDEIDLGLEDGSSKELFLYKTRYIFGGFGLGQWWDTRYLEHFYDFVQEKGGSIGDAEIQCEFIFESMLLNEELWEDITQSSDPFHIGRIIGYMYDGTGELGAETIATYSQKFYERYAE